MSFFKKINYYFWASYRRRKLDFLLEKYKAIYRGIVLDVGGRDRGKFVKPKEQVEKWLVIDISTKNNPDLVADVADMRVIEDGSVDVVNALELFEHVEHIEKGLDECSRVLKDGGLMVISVPFLWLIHNDPSDYQRWSKVKWEKELLFRNYKIEELIIMGRFFSVQADNIKMLIKSLPNPLEKLLRILYPFFDLLIKLDDSGFVRKSNLNNFHSGYFIIAKKNEAKDSL